MSNVCCKEFAGWFKSFTKMERALAVLEAILLVVLVALLILLIMHLIVCSKPVHTADFIEIGTTPAVEEFTLKSVNDSEPNQTNKSDNKLTPNGSSARPEGAGTDQVNEFTEPGKACSWTPSAKTTAAVHYYESTVSSVETDSPQMNGSSTINTTTATIVAFEPDSTTTQLADIEEFIQSEQSDGEEADDKHRSFVVALVKLKPPEDVIFGCILTIVSEYWTLTAASCIEAIEETDSLDSFIIMEQYGTDRKGPLQTVEDVQIHPLYEGRNKSYDLAALKSERSLIEGTGSPVELASVLDYALLPIAERLTILGYGAYRSVDRSPGGRGLRQAHVHVVEARACAAAAAAAGGPGPELRHLWAGRAQGGGACGAVLCAGALAARGSPCNYCAGAPLLLGGALLALMADNQQCGVACEPQLYVSLPDKADWIDATLHRLFND